MTARVQSDGSVDAVAWPFRHRGRHLLAVVAKASFGFAQRSVAPHRGPAPIVREDKTFGDNPTRSIEAASDVVPYKARCDVTVVGHAQRPVVRLSFGSQGRVRIDKSLRVEGGGRLALVYEAAVGGPGTANPVGSETPRVLDVADPSRAGGYGPISAFWPARKRLIQGLDRRAIERGDLPEAIPWDYFQSAPPDQQIEYPRGGEWLVLEGLTEGSPRIETMLPEARVVGSLAFAPTGARRPIELVCDTIHVTPDASSFTLAWRGCVDVASIDLSAATVAVALLAGPTPVDLEALHARAATKEAPVSERREPAPPPSNDATLFIKEEAPRGPALPFAQKEAVGESTHVMSSREHAAHAAGAAAPFAIPPPRASAPTTLPKQGVPWSPEPIPPVPAVSVGEETQAAPAPASPPPGAAAALPASPPAPVPSDPLADRLRGAGASPEEIAMLLAAISTDRKR